MFYSILAGPPPVPGTVVEESGNFFTSIADFFSGIWSVVTGFVESITSLFILLIDSVGLLGAIFAFIPGFIATFALSYMLIRIVKTFIGR